MESNIKPKKRIYKVVRAIETYRAARRNEVRGTDQSATTFGDYPKVVRRSFLSKPPSKYMPHYNGGQFYEYVRPKKVKPVMIDPVTGLPIVIPILSARERHNNKRRHNTKHRAWKKQRSSGLHVN